MRLHGSLTDILQIKLGWKDYLFPKLAHLSNCLQDHVVQIRPTSIMSYRGSESADNASMLSLTKTLKVQQRSNSLVIIEKLPSFIPILLQLSEVNLSHVPGILLDSLNSNPSLLKELPLQANVDRLVEKIPSVWKKVG